LTSLNHEETEKCTLIT